MTSTNAQYQLEMLRDGRVVIGTYRNILGQWPIQNPAGGEHLAMETDGDLVVLSRTGVVIWSSGTAGHPGAFLALLTNGDAAVYAANGQTVLWSLTVITNTLYSGARLRAGQYLTSQNGQFHLIMQADGNLVEYTGPRVVWSTGTQGNPGATALMACRGQLHIISSEGAIIWAGGNEATTSARDWVLVVGDNGQRRLVTDPNQTANGCVAKPVAKTTTPA